MFWSKLLTTLKQLFDTPSAFEGDAPGYLRNALGHALVVGLAMSFLTFVPGALVYGYWEYRQYKLRGGEIYDALEDWAIVMSGALAYLTGDWRVAAVFGAFVVSGFFRRRNYLAR